MYQDIPDHPVVANLLATGEPDGGRRREILCPACGEPCNTFYANRFGSVFACENCVCVDDAEYLMEEPDDE